MNARDYIGLTLLTLLGIATVALVAAVFLLP